VRLVRKGGWNAGLGQDLGSRGREHASSEDRHRGGGHQRSGTKKQEAPGTTPREQDAHPAATGKTADYEHEMKDVSLNS